MLLNSFFLLVSIYKMSFKDTWNYQVAFVNNFLLLNFLLECRVQKWSHFVKCFNAFVFNISLTSCINNNMMGRLWELRNAYFYILARLSPQKAL